MKNNHYVILLLTSFCFFNQLFAQTPPTITSFNPASGPIGTTVTISGTNFNPNAVNNVVYFGAVRAIVVSGTGSSLTVTVPTGATYQPITVTDTAMGLTAYSSKPFVVTFPSIRLIDATTFATKIDIPTGSGPNGVAVGDVDGDGKVDLVVLNQASRKIYVHRNTSASGSINFNGSAAGTTGNDPSSIAMGDIDGDGKLDIVVINSPDKTMSVFRNQSTVGNVSFATNVDYTVGGSPYYAAIGDLDGDGRPDIAVANYGDNTISIFRNTSTMGHISFAPKVDFMSAIGPDGIAIADLNGDGKPDIAVANYTGYNSTGSVSIFKNQSTIGSISFATNVDYTAGTSPRYIAIGDLDNDGKMDIVVANCYSNTVSVFRNQGMGGNISFETKADYTTGGWPSSIILGDIDGDGKPDLAVANDSNSTISVMQNQSLSGSISFATTVNYTMGSWIYPQSITMGDIDGDGKPDLAVANSGSNTVSILMNSAVSNTLDVVSVSGGTFQMGSNNAYDYLASPMHSVTLSSYYIDKYEVTYEKWTEVRNWALMHGYSSAEIAKGGNGYFPVGTNNPVGAVNWYDIVKWCNARSEKDGLTPVYYTSSKQDTVYRTGELDLPAAAVKWTAHGYRLPTEAEWEFAARGGNQTHGYVYSGSNTIGEVAWYYLNSGNTTHQVGIKSANELGIFDMSGNVSEWCWDWLDYYNASPQIDPKGPNPIPGYYQEHIVRGGSLTSAGPQTDDCRVAYRSGYGTAARIDNYGFRCASSINAAYPNTAPAAPQNLAATAGNGQITLRWNKNTESDFLKYWIYMGRDSTTLALKDSTTASITDTTKTITGLTNGTKYYFRISAMDSARLESGKSFAVLGFPNVRPGSMIILTLDTASVSSIGQNITLFLKVQNFVGIGSVTLKISYDTTQLTYTGLDTPPAAFGGNAVKGIILFGGSSVIGISKNDGDRLFGLKFTYNGRLDSGKTSLVAFVKEGCEITDTLGNVLSSEYFNGAIKSMSLLKFSGAVRYYGINQTPVSNVLITLTANSGINRTAVSGVDGSYSFNNLNSGQYTLTATKTGNWGGVNATDAFVVARHAVGLSLLTGLPLAAADVNTSGSINSTDALAIVRRAVGLDTSFAAGDWVFSPQIVTVSSANVTANISGLCMGDVNASYTPSSGTVFAKSNALVNLRTDAAENITPVGTFEIPIRVISEISLGAVSLKINFPSDMVTFESISSKLYGFISRADEGSVIIAWANMNSKNAMHFNANEALVSLKFSPKVSKGTVGISVDSWSELVDAKGEVISTGLSAPTAEITNLPTVFELGQNYPNPFNPSTTIRYSLPCRSQVRIQVFNMLGQMVSELVHGEQAAGYQSVIWNATVASGMYLYRIEAGSFIQTKKMVIMK